LLEASVIQWYWLQDTHKDRDQFNSIHEKLQAKLKDIYEYIEGWPLYFTHSADTEDMMTVSYLRDVAQQAGYKTEALTVAEIGWNGECFVDLAANRIHSIYKLYPWEWLLDEAFAPHLMETYSSCSGLSRSGKWLPLTRGSLRSVGTVSRSSLASGGAHRQPGSDGGLCKETSVLPGGR
jgi:hypothetical protein